LISISTHYAAASNYVADLVALFTYITTFLVFQPGDVPPARGG